MPHRIRAHSCARPHRSRPRIVFFEYANVFEDFYPQYGIDQREFATHWAATGNHAFVSLLQRDIGDVVWYAFSLQPELNEAQHSQTGCRVRFLQSSWVHRQLWALYYLPRSAWRWRRLYRCYATLASYVAPLSPALLRALKSDRPDIFFVQEYSSGRFDVLLIVSRILGIPLIAYHAGSYPDSYLGKSVKRWTLPRAGMLIVSSTQELRYLADHYPATTDQLRMVLTPIDTASFFPIERETACERIPLRNDRHYLLFVGRLDDRVKRVSSLIRTFARLAPARPEWDLIIVGDGPDADRLQAMAIESAPHRVHFLGWRSGAEKLTPIYNAAVCLVLPSMSEGFPTVVGEAMACGIPVLATRVGGIPELVIEGKTGWLIPPGDDDALERALASVISHPEAVRVMRPDARKTAEDRVSYDAVSAALSQSFNEALARG